MAIILVVEDNGVNAMLIRAVLQRAGHTATVAESAEQAREILRSVRPDLVLMDIQLPGEDGLTLTRSLKGDPSTASISIVALSAHAMTSDRERARAAGCDGYIVKPINTRTFPGEIAPYISRSGLSVEGSAGE